MLEAIGRLRQGALDEKKVGVGQAFESGSESVVVDLCDSSQQRVREAASKDRADLGDLARFAEPVEPGRERLLKRRRDRLQPARLAALEQKPRDLLDEQWHPTGALTHPLDHLLA